MTIYIQHGYGKGEKIDKALEDNSIGGIILNPSGESPEKLQQTISLYAESGINIMFDPQFYACVIDNACCPRLAGYPYFTSNLTQRDFISPKKIFSYISDIISFQNDLNLNTILSPTCMIDSFEGSWNQVALTMAQCSIEFCEDNNIKKEVYSSFVISELAFRSDNIQALNDFIASVTSFNCNNIYLIIERSNRSYKPHMDPDILENILYLIFCLADRNNIKIVCGYADLIGLLYLTAGASAIGTGWHYKLRQFSRSNFEESTGGRTPKDRYTSLPLLSSIYNSPELSRIIEENQLGNVLSGTPYDNIILEDGAISPRWTQNISYYHHLFSLNKLSAQIQEFNNVDQRVDFFLNEIKKAKSSYNKLRMRNVLFDNNNNGYHLEQWEEALNNFKSTLSNL